MTESTGCVPLLVGEGIEGVTWPGAGGDSVPLAVAPWSARDVERRWSRDAATGECMSTWSVDANNDTAPSSTSLLLLVLVLRLGCANSTVATPMSVSLGGNVGDANANFALTVGEWPRSPPLPAPAPAPETPIPSPVWPAPLAALPCGTAATAETLAVFAPSLGAASLLGSCRNSRPLLPPSEELPVETAVTSDLICSEVISFTFSP